MALGSCFPAASPLCREGEDTGRDQQEGKQLSAPPDPPRSPNPGCLRDSLMLESHLRGAFTWSGVSLTCHTVQVVEKHRA